MLFKVYKIVPITLIILLTIGIVANIFVPFSLSMSILLIISAILIWRNWRKLKHAADNISPKSMKLIIEVSLAVIFIIQLLVITYLPATVYHDPFRVLHQAELLNTSHYSWGDITYFWRYPNNVPLTYFLSLWFKFTDIFNLTHNVAIHILSMITLDSFILMAVYTVRKIYRRNIGTIIGLIFLVFGPFAYTYYLQVFYTDLPNMLFMLVVFNLINNWEKMTRLKKTLSGIVIVVLMLLGQLLKPNLIILSVAVVIVIVGFWVVNRNSLKKIIVPLLLVMVGLGLASPVKTVIQHETGFVANTKYQLPTAHWIWMSYNPKSAGAYNKDDVREMLSYPTEKQRTKYIKHALPKRFEQLGPIGLVQKWTMKIALLLNVDTIPGAYTGGYMEIPATYANIQYVVELISQFIMRLGFILLYAIGLLRAIKMLMEKQEEAIIMQALAALTLVGYLLFHVFLWESGARYGQVIVPLLLMMNVESDGDLRKQVQLGQFKIFILLAILSGIIGALIVPQSIFPHGPMFISAQRSHLSRQYGYQASAVSPKYSVSQKVTINHWVTELAVSAPGNKNINAKLVNENTKHVEKMQRDKTIFYVDHKLKPGTYKMIFTAKDKNKPFKVMMTKMQKYQLAPHSLIMNGKSYKYRSLIYQASYYR